MCRKKARRFLGVTPAAIIQLRGARVTMPGGLLHVFELAPFSSAVVMKVARIECAE